MNERTTLEKIAPTVEEAIAEGLAELGLTAEAVDVEVLDDGSRGLFGIGGRQARVRLTVKPQSASHGAENQTGTVARTEPSTRAGANSPSAADDDAFTVLDDNLLFISRQTVAELLEKMKIQARIEVAMVNQMRKDNSRSKWIFRGMIWLF